MTSVIDTDALYEELQELHSKPQEEKRFTAEEERVWAGFEEIARFCEEHNHAPRCGDERDIFERLYAARLAALKRSARWRQFLQPYDRHHLLSAAAPAGEAEDLSEEALLAELGAEFGAESGLTKLVHVRPHKENRPREVPEEKAVRKPCSDFAQFKPLFDQTLASLKSGACKTERFTAQAMEVGDFFILSGQMLYIAEKGEAIATKDHREQAQLRVIYDNGLESNMLLHSVRTALYRDKTGRSIKQTDAGPLFGSAAERDDISGGVIYVLESLSDRPNIATQKGLLHKIGVTGGDVRKRIANAVKDPTFLLADVKIVREYKLYNIKRAGLERLLHKFFAAARADIVLKDLVGNPIAPQEWFFVPLSAVDEAVARIKDGTLPQFRYDPASALLIETAE